MQSNDKQTYRQLNQATDKSINIDIPKKTEHQQRKKAILLRQLENELKHLDDMEDDYTSKKDDDGYKNDYTLSRLQMIAKEAAKLQIIEIQKLARLAIGKRILNIQLKKKKDQHNIKLRRKEKMKLFFRENRIKKFDYDTLIEQKLTQSTFIARAYQNGKGFVQSDAVFKEKYEQALVDCNYNSTIKEVNKIFYNNYSGANHGNSSTETVLKFIWIPIILFLALGISLFSISFPHQQKFLILLLTIILIMLAYASMRTFFQKPTQNNQIQQSMVDVSAYFQKINEKLTEKNIEWSCPKDFMYLEVIFHSGFPSSTRRI